MGQPAHWTRRNRRSGRDRTACRHLRLRDDRGRKAARAQEIAGLAKANQALAERFDPASPAIAAELIFAVDSEFAETLADVFSRRILLAYEPGHGLQGVKRAAEILAAHLGWDAGRGC